MLYIIVEEFGGVSCTARTGNCLNGRPNWTTLQRLGKITSSRYGVCRKASATCLGSASTSKLAKMLSDFASELLKAHLTEHFAQAPCIRSTSRTMMLRSSTPLEFAKATPVDAALLLRKKGTDAPWQKYRRHSGYAPAHRIIQQVGVLLVMCLDCDI